MLKTYSPYLKPLSSLTNELQLKSKSIKIDGISQ